MTTFGANGGGVPSFEDYYASTATFSGGRRLAADVATARASYGATAWATLNRREQDGALDDALVPPHVRLRYSAETNGDATHTKAKPALPDGVTSVYPRLRMKTGLKRVTVDVDGGSGSQGEDLDSASSGCVSDNLTLMPSVLSSPALPLAKC
jgi:hypothetical protein